MIRTLKRLAWVTACAAVLSVPALAHDGRRVSRNSVVVVVNGHDRDDGWRRGGWDRGRRVGWRGCDLPPGLAKKYGCYDRPVLLVPRHYRPRGVTLVFTIR
jgi:hypothetical protein